MESELAQAQQAEAEARKGRQAAEANSEQLREESEQLLREELKALLARNWQAVLGAVAAVASVATATVVVLNWWRARPETITNRAADVLLNSKVDDVMELSKAIEPQAIMARPRLAEALARLGKQTAYVIIEGPRGSGKTTGVMLALSGKPGVLRVKMTSETDACVAIAKQGAPYARRGRQCDDTDHARGRAAQDGHRKGRAPDHRRGVQPGR